MRVAIGSDHAGFDLKEAVKIFLRAEKCEVIDVGTSDRDPVDYTDFAEAVGAAVQCHNVDRGILLCGSGVGASMAANRIPGVRAGLCHDTYSAHQGVEHDNMNVLVLGGRVVGSELARELIHAFLGARFSGEERHLRRLAKMTALENPLRALGVFGQSVWLDYVRRSLISSGDLSRLIEEDGLTGLTSNPSIFEKAIAGSSDYQDLLEAPGAASMDPKSLYERLANASERRLVLLRSSAHNDRLLRSSASKLQSVGDIVELERARPCSQTRRGDFDNRVGSDIDERDVVAVEGLEVSIVQAEPLGSDRMIVGHQQLGHFRIAHDAADLVADELRRGVV